MRSNVFKLSAIAVTVCASFGAHAALYNVYLVDPEGTNVETHGVAIAQSTELCWTTTDCNAIEASFDIAVETRKNAAGFAYRDEAPFLLRDGFAYIDGDLYDEFYNYCRSYLAYDEQSCRGWATSESNGYALEVGGDYSNSKVYIDETAFRDGLGNIVVNSFDAAGNVIGNYQQDNAVRNVGFVGTSDLDVGSGDRSRAWSSVENGASQPVVVGSLSTQVNSIDYTSKAAVWINGGAPIEISWESGAAINGDIMPQGAARDIAKIGSVLYAVGYNTRNDGQRLSASAFVSNDDGTTWSTKYVPLPSDVNNYANSKLTNVNNNGVAIGEAKLSIRENQAIPNKLFYVSNVADAALNYNNFSGSIFFTGANGKAGGINNFNEVVGQIDYEKKGEVNGAPRARRAFVTTIGSVSTSPLAGQSRYLDDLTMGGGALSSNNQYRIIDATDINDAGVISGTALYCSGGYDSQAINSTCQGGTQGAEKLVAVKLVPIAAGKGRSIEPRPVDTESISRSGGSLGWLALGLLTLLGFRRKQ